MIKLLVRTDCHINDKSPQSRTDDYLETCLKKLRQLGDFAREKQCTAVIDNGDFFHDKAATKNSHEMVRKIIDLHRKEYPCPIYLNPGNHDFPYNNISYIEKQPLGVLFAAGVFQQLNDITFTGSNDLKVRVVGIPYRSDIELLDFDIEKGEEDVLIVAAHTFASLNGGDLFGRETALSYYDLSSCSPQLFIFGHWHIDQGIQELNGKTFMNLGSMTRGSLTQDNLSRTPRFGYIEVTKDSDGVVTIHTEAHEYIVEKSELIFDLEKHSRIKEEERDIEKFIASLVSSGQTDQEEDITQSIRNLSHFQEEVREKAIEFLLNAIQ